jgi:N utilization substance protein B
MGNRRKARELAVQILFHMEYNPGDPDETFELICENLNAPNRVRPYSKQLVCGVCKNIENIDRLIKESSKNWRLERMSRVDRSILRMSVFEIFFLESIPRKVSINEAVELAKKYGTDESGAFINGVLDNIHWVEPDDHPAAGSKSDYKDSYE